MYDELADDYFVNLNLNTEMQLPSQRETVLEFCGRVQKSYPSMRNFYTRDQGDFVLEEDKESPRHRWMCLESRRICSGFVNPPTVDDAMEQHLLLLSLAPYMLSVSPLDCEALDLLFGFEFVFRGNHDELVADALGTGTMFDGLLDIPGARPLKFEPNITMALRDDCRRQCRLTIETRTSAYQVRRNEFGEEPISVYFTLRQYGSLPHDGSFEETLKELRQDAERLLESSVIEQVLKPLARAISQR